MKTYAQLPARYQSLIAATSGSLLLQTSRFDTQNYRSYLFAGPNRIIRAGGTLFDENEQALDGGSYVAGYLSYEFGKRLQGLGQRDLRNLPTPLAWFGVYPKVFGFDHSTGKFEGSPQTKF